MVPPPPDCGAPIPSTSNARASITQNNCKCCRLIFVLSKLICANLFFMGVSPYQVMMSIGYSYPGFKTASKKHDSPSTLIIQGESCFLAQVRTLIDAEKADFSFTRLDAYRKPPFPERVASRVPVSSFPCRSQTSEERLPGHSFGFAGSWQADRLLQRWDHSPVLEDK